MRPAATRPTPGRIARAIVLALGLSTVPCLAQQLLQPAVPSPATKYLLILPTVNAEDHPPSPSGAALTAAEEAAFPMHLHFGMSPEEVNARLAHPAPSVAPAALTKIPYLLPAEVDAFTAGLADIGDLKPFIQSCYGEPSRVIFEFVARKLYALSFRFEHDKTCPNAAKAADDLFAHLLAIPEDAMPSERYRVGDVDVVDAWDKSVDAVVRERWRGQ